MKRLLVVAALSLALPLAAQNGEEKEKPKNPAMGNLQAIEAGKKLFAGSCAACHGTAGQGGGRGPNLRQRTAWHPLDDDALFKTIQKGVPGADMPPSNLREEQIWQLAAFVRSLTAPAFETPVVAGSAQEGETLFWGKAGCSGCHRIRGRGGFVGPDLGNIAAVRPLEDIREAVLDPDAEIAQGYRGITVVRKDGRTIRGVARNRTNYSVQVQDASGDLHLLLTTDLKEIMLDPHSPMPRDYKDRLTSQELDNLLAYLSRQSMRPPTPPEKK